MALKKDPKEAMKYFKLAAAQGNAVAQVNIGYFYHIGEGVAPNYKKAKKYYTLAAKQGDPSAKTNLRNLKNEKARMVQQEKDRAAKRSAKK